MNRMLIKKIAVILFISGLIFTAYKYIFYLKDNIRELENQKQNLLQELEKEKNTVEKLRVKNELFKNNLQAVNKRLNKSFLELRLLEKRSAELNSRTALLIAENSSLQEDKARLSEENEALKSTLTSITELKAIIRDLKRLKRQEGNRGFLIKSGESTSVSKVKIEVMPAPSK